MRKTLTSVMLPCTLVGLLLVAGLGVLASVSDGARRAGELPGGVAVPSGPWRTTEVVSAESTSTSEFPSLVVDAIGNVHVTWQDSSNYAGSGADVDIFYKWWNATTATWSATEVVSTESTGTSYSPSLEVDAGGKVHVAWHDLTNYAGSGSDWDIFYKCKPAGGAWPAATEVVSTESTTTSSYASLAVDAGGNVHVAWQDWTNYTSSGTDADVFYKCKPAGGAWPAATEVISTESTANSEGPSLGVDAGGNVHVAWQDGTNYAGSGVDIDTFYKCKLAGGTWPAMTEVVSTESTGNSYSTTLVVDAGGNVHVAWNDPMNYAGSGADVDIFYKWWSATTSAWSATEVVSTESTGDSRFASLAVDVGGNVHVAWHDLSNYTGSGTDSDIFYKRKLAGGTWPTTTEVVSTESTDNSYYPSMAVDAGGNVHVAWRDATNYSGSGTDYDIFYKVSPRVPATPVLNPITPSTSTTGAVDVTWLPSDNAAWYYVYKASQYITWTVGLTPLARVVPGREFTDTVTANGTWYYAVVAGNVYYNSSVSNCVQVVVGIPPQRSTTGTIPESAFYTVVGAMAVIAILALVVGVLAGRRGAARPAKRAARDEPPAPAVPSKTR